MSDDIEIRRIQTPRELNDSFRLRFEIYCLPVGSDKPSDLNPEDYPDGLERDEWDKHSVHFGAFYKNKLVGSLRLIKDSSQGFLMETHFVLPKNLDRAKGLEASRMVVAPTMRGRKLMERICDVATTWSVQSGYTWWCLAVHDVLLNPLEQHGWQIKKLGPASLYHNIMAYPIVVTFMPSR